MLKNTDKLPEQDFFDEISLAYNQQADHKIKVAIKDALRKESSLFSDERPVEVILKQHRQEQHDPQIIIN